ncbi:MAG: hypothetical protein PSV36_03725 [Algoriphagus sp.]|nr:hypothetical protein [Algoriphagus sp.]
MCRLFNVPLNRNPMMVIIGIRRVDKTIRKNIRSLNSAGILVASGTAYKINPKTRDGMSNG